MDISKFILELLSGHIPFWLSLLISAVILAGIAAHFICKENEIKLKEISKTIWVAIGAIVFVLIGVSANYINNGYTKDFKVTVRDKNDNILTPSSVTTDISEGCYQIMSSNRPAIIKLCNKDMSVYLKGQHRALEATKEFKLSDFVSFSSRVAVKMIDVTNKVYYRRSEKAFKGSNSNNVKPDDSGVDLYTSKSAHEAYVTLTPKVLDSVLSYDIRTSFFMYKENTRYFIEIGNALRVTIGEPGMNSVEVFTNPSREADGWGIPKRKILESQLYLGKQLKVWTAVKRSREVNKLIVTVYNDRQENKDMEFDLGDLSLIPVIKIGAINSNPSKERVMRLIETDITTNADSLPNANKD